MPISRVDVLLVVPPAEAPYALVARAKRVIHLERAVVPPRVLAELRAAIPRKVAVLGEGPPAVEVASAIRDAGLVAVLLADEPPTVPAGLEVQPVTDPGPAMETTDSLLDLIGETPLLSLHRTGRDLACHLLAKLEYLNPGGSVKDRPALAMIDAAERDGLLVAGGTIVEPTSGNTGVGLAMVAAQRGYHCIFTMPDKIAPEKMQLLRAFGAEVVVCPTAVAPEHPESYYSVAERLAETTPRAFRPNQYRNPENPASHVRTTGPEIWRQTTHRITHFVAGIGTGGTISGIGRFLKDQNPDIQIVGADPVGSVYSGGGGRPYLVEGIGEDFWPSTYDAAVVDRVVAVSDADSFATARRVTREEGLLVGGSCGTAIWAALEIGRDLGPDAVVVVLLPDSGRGYLSKLYSDAWMADHGFLQASGPTVGEVLGSKTGSIPPLVHIHPDESVRSAIAILREYEVSQMPVVKAEPPLALAEIVGSVSDRALLERALGDPAVMEQPVSKAMSPPMPTIGTGETIDQVAARLQDSPAVLALDRGHPVGILTRSDLLAYLARK
ncbi:MAG TPA: cystathionine beta-synthase [Acidimicrobiales bacterium]|nr:cystathionine beta-synthase [Acidimicrobiales bacterium]